MASGVKYDTDLAKALPEYCDVESIYRRFGGFNLDIVNLMLGAIIPSLAPLHVDFSTRTATVIKNVKVVEIALANATAIKVAKNSLVYVGEKLGKGSVSAEVTAIDKTNANYDLLTISLGVAVSVGDVLFEAAAASAATAGTKGIYTLTITTNPTAGDKLSINDTEYEFAAAPDAGKVVVGATNKATAVNLDSVLEQVIALTDVFNLSYNANKVIFTQKVAGVGDIPTIVVTAVPSTGTLAASIAETTEGAAPVVSPAAPRYVCNGLNYVGEKVEAGATCDAIGAVMEILENKLEIPVSAEDKASLGARFDFITEG